MLWNTLCLDLICLYEIDIPNNKKLTLHCVTMIDPATGWFEIVEIPKKSGNIVSNAVETTWLSRHPWPTKIALDRGKEFMAKFIDIIKNDYNDIKLRRITTRNPQANSIVERVHQTIGNMMRTFSYKELDPEDPWTGILSAVAFAVRAAVHATM